MMAASTATRLHKHRVRSAATILAAALLPASVAFPVLAQEEKVLNIDNWSDYIAGDTVKNVEKETGIKVRYDVFDNNELLHAKMVADKTGYDIVALIPKAAATLFFDTMAIPVDAPHPTNAHVWINDIMRPDVHAPISNKVFYANANAAATTFVKKESAENKTICLSDEDKKKMLVPDVLNADIRRT